MAHAGRAARAAGFTLLEMLVVILIIGVVTAGMLLSMSFAGKDTQLQTESKRLLSLMKYARDQAQLQTRDYGIVFGQHGYEFSVYGIRSGAWRPVLEDDVLRERTLPRGLDFKLVVDARQIVLSEQINIPKSPADGKTAAANGGSSATPAQPETGSDTASSPDSDTDSTVFAPQVMIFSSGDLSSFEITLERPANDHSITLHENQDGNIVQKVRLGSGS